MTYVDSILSELPMSADGTGHIADCGWTESDLACGCFTLRERLARIIEIALVNTQSRHTRDEQGQQS